ncbi:rho guanine nucleotide exchange factor 12-like [Corticium candelabrum]|uniref:rho guanine nucleotide exchange factor 12-like n=1 Tax=Corticium candelabrum TaxID=121492 RepID=UPI002E253B8A|nr:rho guanine nucleotide exchange factor 12-like [Corticium candelabrum]
MEKTESPKNTRIEALLSEQRGENMKERTVSILKEDGVGYGLTVSGDNPVFVQAVKEDGPAARAGVHAGDRILMVNDRCVSKSGHVEVVQLIKTAKVVNLRLLGIPSLKSKTSLTSLPPMARRKSGTMMDQVISPPIHATERDKQRAVELKSTTLERMLKQEQQFYKDRCVEYTKSPTPKLEKEINDSSGRIQTLERQLSVSEIKVQLVVAPQPVASQAVSTSEESSVAAMERHSVAVDRSVSTTSMPDSKTGTPIGKRKRKSKKSSSSSQPDSPLSPLCSNGHTVRINSDGRSGSTLDFNTTVSDVSHNSVANICIDASDEDEDMKTDDSTGPFSDLALLEKMPAHLAVFVNYLISDTSHDPSNLFFYLVSGVYQRYQGTKDLKRMANDIYQTFFLLTAPLKLDIESAIVKHIESTFKSKSATDESLHVVFSKARECAFAVVARQLSVFRAKRALGLGSMFGDTVLSEHLPKSNYVEVISQLLLPPLQQMTSYALVSFSQ